MPPVEGKHRQGINVISVVSYYLGNMIRVYRGGRGVICIVHKWGIRVQMFAKSLDFTAFWNLNLDGISLWGPSLFQSWGKLNNGSLFSVT